MKSSTLLETIPIVLFAYARPDHLQKTLDGLRANQIPFIYAFSDGPRTPDKADAVSEVRRILHSIDWCPTVITERETNIGLGKSIVAGVTDVLSKHEAAIVIEDDLVCVPGAYQYLVAALQHYREEARVMSVTAWTHSAVTPSKIKNQPYFDGRAECWMWGTWARAWKGMATETALDLVRECTMRGIDVYRYGKDLPQMAVEEIPKNIWAVRWLYHHLLQGGLCLRPPYSMVEHIGFDEQATNAVSAGIWTQEALLLCPPLPLHWPSVIENTACPILWRRVYGTVPALVDNDENYNHANSIYSTQTLKQTIDRVLSPFVAFYKNRRREGWRHTLKQWTPPALIPVIRTLKSLSSKRFKASNYSQQIKPEWEYMPTGWQYQNKDPNIKGWNVPSIVEAYMSRWPDFVSSLEGTFPFGIAPETFNSKRMNIYTHNMMMSYAYALAVAVQGKTSVSILDWGGGIGHYYLISKTLFPSIHFDYHCKDLPLLAAQGQKLFPEAHFYTDDDQAFNQSYDFVLSSSSLQYSENWNQSLARLTAVTAGHLLVTRLPTVHKVPSYVMVQRPYAYGYNTEYLGWCLNRTELLSVVEPTALELVREFLVEASPTIHNAPEQCDYWGYLFKNRQGNEHT